jgi:hypothetical protein
MTKGPAPMYIMINPTKCVIADPGSRIFSEIVDGRMPKRVASRIFVSVVIIKSPHFHSVCYFLFRSMLKLCQNICLVGVEHILTYLSIIEKFVFKRYVVLKTTS